MQEWLQSRGYSWDAVDVLVALVLALVGAVATLHRFGIRRLFWLAALRLGLVDRSYAAWFVRIWGRYDNPYLRASQHLDLRSTYVSLSCREHEADTRIDAQLVLADRSTGNIIIEGDPGSGKSTLLRAYGVGAGRRTGRHGHAAGPPETPFFVPLRRFARTTFIPGRTLTDHVIRDILVSGRGWPRPQAEAFLRRALLADRVVLLLDGLDEVPADRQQAVLEAVHRFSEDRDPHLPTWRARIILTCRRQNFLALRDQWIYVVKDGVYTLAPLRDSEIFAMLANLRTQFSDPEAGPAAFLHAVRASGALDLHRNPLVLAMSVGLYARRTTFEIPGEIADLYDQMITEMLERQAFRADPGTGLLRYTVADKIRLLREFALANAEGQPGCGERFGEFPLDALHRQARALASRLDSVDDPVAFVTEIIDRAGLIVALGDRGYVFAHRSIQEYLVAEELRQYVPDGAGRLLRRAGDPAWRQVVLFYTGTDRHNQQAVDAFLRRLAGGDLALAGHCLAGAKATNQVADEVLNALAVRVRSGDDVGGHLAAMLAATRSPRRAVRGLAAVLVREVLAEVIHQPDVFELLGGDLGGVTRILDALAVTDAGSVAELAPRVAEAAPDDPRLVAPLWLCLAVPGMADQPDTGRLVERLLALVMTQEGMVELQHQEPAAPDFATAELRRSVYPFRHGHRPESNLVTLLCWAERLGVVPLPLNRFYQARREDPPAFATVEADRERTQLTNLHRPARLASVAGAAAALGGSAWWLGHGWRALTAPAGWLTLWWVLAPLVAAPVAFFVATGWAERRPGGSWPGRYLRAGAAPGSGSSGHLLAELLAKALPGSGAQLTVLLVTVGYAVAPLPLLATSPLGYLAAATAANAVLGWLPFLRVCDRGTSLYLYRPNPYADMYDDPRSLPWLDPGALTGGPLAAAAAPAPAAATRTTTPTPE